MSVIEVPIDQAKVGMYLVGIDVSWMKSPFYKHRFLLSSAEMIKQLAACGVKVISVDRDKSQCSFAGEPERPTQSTPPPVNRELPAVGLSKEMGQAKSLRSQSVKQLGLMLNGTLEAGSTMDVSAMASIVEETHNSTLRNAHALLNLFHVNSRYDDLAAHCYGVMSIALMLGQRMDLSDEELSLLGSASLLMDVGWAKLPNQLFKNLVPYTEDEYALIQTHVDLSVELLETAKVDDRVIDLVAKHHERIDGSGYFSQYKGDDVPLMAQIMALADHYDSLIKGYYDSGSVIPATALKHIFLAANQGKHARELVELLIQLVGVYPVSSAVLLNTGEKALVTKVNWRDSLRPQIRIHYSKQGLNLLKPMEVDLYQQQETDGRKILKVLDPTDKRQDPLGLLSYNP
jgi:HD-GYP domain-containing protein (c-di-GMP phosphodiesterase class II)